MSADRAPRGYYLAWMSLIARLARSSLPLGTVGGGGAYDLLRHSDIVKAGWLTTRACGLPVDAAGAPLPWYTYPAIAFLKSRLPLDIDVFEYGCGYSTLWWMRRAKSVISVEHASSWAQEIRTLIAPNVRLIEIPAGTDSSYADTIAPIEKTFEVIVVDGEHRVACMRQAPQHLTPTGVVILDNAERPEYAPGLGLLREHGFRRVDFCGMGPINTYAWTTSILYRSTNRLGL